MSSRSGRRRLRVAGVMATVTGGPILLSGVAYGAGAAAPSAPEGLTLSQSVGEAVLGAPVTVTLTARAPAARAAYGLVLTDTLPAGATYVPGSAVLAIGGVTIPLPLHVALAAAPGAGPTLVVRGVPDLPAGTSASVSFQIATAAPLDAVLALRAEAVAGGTKGASVPLDASGLPVVPLVPHVPTARAVERSAAASASATVAGLGVAVVDSGPAALTPPGATPGATVTATAETTIATITVSEAAGLSPAPVRVDAYLPAGVRVAPPPAASPTAVPPATVPPAAVPPAAVPPATVPPATVPPAAVTGGGPAAAPTATAVTLVTSQASPSIPAVPVRAPAPAGAPVPGDAATLSDPSAPFTDLRWDVPAVGAGTPATLEVTLDVPAAGAPVLVVASASTLPAAPPATTPDGTAGPSGSGGVAAEGPGSVAAVPAPVTSSQSALDTVPALPATPPASDVHPRPAAAPALPSAPVAPVVALRKTVSAPPQLTPLGSPPAPELGKGPPAVRTAAATPPSTAASSSGLGTRNPFVVPGAASSAAAATPVAAPGSAPPTTQQPRVTAVTSSAPASAPSTRLAYTGAPVGDELLIAALAILAGAAMAAAAVSQHRSPRLPGEARA